MLKLRLFDPEPGSWRRFPAGMKEVRIGRDPLHCDFVLDAGDTRVSRQHCALQLVLGRYRLLLNQQNPVFIDEKRAFEGQVLLAGSVLRLGHEGPRMQVEIEPEADLAITRTLEVPPDSPQVQLEHVEQRLEKRIERHRLWTGLVVVAVLGGIVLGVFRLLSAESTLASLAAKQLTKDERLAVSGLLTPKIVPTFAEILQQAHDSVYLVMREKNGVAEPMGTAWVVDRERGLLATNAHVANQLDVDRAFVRSSAREPVDFQLASMRQHPGYERFTRLADASAAGGPVSPGSDPTSLITGCDTALLEVRKEQRARLGEALPLAGQDDLLRLSQGTPVAYLGHPLEGLPGNYQRPEVRAQIGHVTAVSDFFLGSAEAVNAQLILTNLPATGGASGSPILNERGQVVAVLSAASFINVAGRRIPIGVGLTYGQRVDLLRELLDGDAVVQVAQSARDPVWERAFDAIRSQAGKELRASLIEMFANRLRRQNGKPLKAVTTVLTKRERLEQGKSEGARDYELHLVEEASYLVLAVCEQRTDIDLLVLRKADVAGSDLDPDFFPAVGLFSTGNEDLKVAVFAKEALAAPVDFELTLVRFDK